MVEPPFSKFFLDSHLEETVKSDSPNRPPIFCPVTAAHLSATEYYYH